MVFPAFLFPAFLVIILFAAALPALITTVYLQVYKRRINSALRGGGGCPAMAPPYKVVIVLTVMVLFIGVIVSLFTGYKLAHDYFEEDTEELSALDLQAFYAEVREVGEHTITVEGIPLNEEPYRGTLQYEVWGETSVVGEGAPLSLTDLRQGDLVSLILISGAEAPLDLFKIQRIAPSGTYSLPD